MNKHGPFTLMVNALPSEDQVLANMLFTFDQGNNPIAREALRLLNEGKNIIFGTENNYQIFVPFNKSAVIDGGIITFADTDKFNYAVSLACLAFDEVKGIPIKLMYKMHPLLITTPNP